MANKIKFSDKELMLKFQNGDELAYNELVNRYKNKLLNFIYRYFGSKDDAEDILQETFIKLYYKKDYYKPISEFSTWIYTIAANLSKTELRKRKRRKTSQLSEMGVENKEFDIRYEDDTDLEINTEYNEHEINKAIQDLETPFRTAFILRDIQELSYEEISKITEVPLGTIKSRINRARIQLQGKLKEIYKNRS
tara:strand:- start:1603 stop:2184 length:582 start_codon:yes stop_codon:yes gene_type:complete